MYLAISILLTAIDGYDELIECNAVVSYISLRLTRITA